MRASSGTPTSDRTPLASVSEDFPTWALFDVSFQVPGAFDQPGLPLSALVKQLNASSARTFSGSKEKERQLLCSQASTIPEEAPLHQSLSSIHEKRCS